MFFSGILALQNLVNFGDRFVICDTGLYELVPAFILSIIVIVVVSLIDKKPSQQVYDEFNRVCTEKFD